VDAVSRGDWTLPPEFLWIARGEGHAVSALPAGARANTSAISVFAPDAARAFWAHGTKVENSQMKQVLHERLEPLMEIRAGPRGAVGGLKAGMEACGQAGGFVRPPGRGVMDSDRGRIAELAGHAEDNCDSSGGVARL
jgi:dihydrodipicolinate synthase/N-acetylneuraminate lyase